MVARARRPTLEEACRLPVREQKQQAQKLAMKTASLRPEERTSAEMTAPAGGEAGSGIFAGGAGGGSPPLPAPAPNKQTNSI